MVEYAHAAHDGATQDTQDTGIPMNDHERARRAYAVNPIPHEHNFDDLERGGYRIIVMESQRTMARMCDLGMVANRWFGFLRDDGFDPSRDIIILNAQWKCPIIAMIVQAAAWAAGHSPVSYATWQQDHDEGSWRWKVDEVALNSVSDDTIIQQETPNE